VSIPTATPTPTATPSPTATPCLLGDINCDGIVDIRDYGIWRQNFGQTNCGNPADLNGDCIVDIRDYGIWRANFGHTGPGAPPVTAAGRPLLGAPPGPSVRPLSLARQPAVADAAASEAWPRQALAHIGRLRPWDFAAAVGITVPREIMLRLAEAMQ
jgi:hypothetical protein